MPRELSSDLAILERLIEFRDKIVVDVGCGGGALVRDLSARGADVIGLEISEQQLATALERDDQTGARYLVGRAEALPLDDGSVDVVVFMRTLHHVPPDQLTRALSEAARVLRPAGSTYVAEPLAEGDYFQLVSLIEDERDVRAAAQAALANAALAGLVRITTIDYDVRVSLRDLAALRARVVSVDPAREELFDARTLELAEAFERLGEPGEQPGARSFLLPMRADVLRPVAR